MLDIVNKLKGGLRWLWKVPTPYKVAVANIVIALIAVVALALAIPSFQRTNAYAKQGRAAQKRLTYLAPLVCKLYRDAYQRHVFTYEDFRNGVSPKNGFAGHCSTK